MAILDKLMEKKDIQAYCNFRERHLRHESVIALRLVPKEKRQSVRERFNGRLLELNELKKNIANLKGASIRESLECYKYEDKENKKKEDVK